MMIRNLRSILFGFTLFLSFVMPMQVSAEDKQTVYRGWINDMKGLSRGPFTRLRWYCADGSILPPVAYACESHGGGVQHGELNTQAQRMRRDGFYVANVLSGGKGARVGVRPGKRDELAQLLLERYLIARDDGWIFRGARTYRGAIQSENESAAARALLYRLAQLPSLPNQDFLLLREAYRLLPRLQDTPEASQVRDLSATLAEKDRAFEVVRAKIHAHPEASDAHRVRRFANEKGQTRLANEYARLATAIDRVFQKSNLTRTLGALMQKIRSARLKNILSKAITQLSLETRADQRMILAASLLAELRQGFVEEGSGSLRLDFLEISLQLEQEVFRTGAQLPVYVNKVPRLQQVSWLQGLNDANYGIGLISARQWQSVKGSLKKLESKTIPLSRYHGELLYAGRASAWAAHWLSFHFSEAVAKYSIIEPKTAGFIPDRLRGSSMLIYSQILDGLSADANRLTGLQHRLFNESVGASLRPLNAGFARGVLHLSLPVDGRLKTDGIYLLNETTPELTPVAGILTRGEGNALSHIQLLASNLGVPNVVVGERLFNKLKPYDGRRIVMAVSASGAIDIELDGEKWVKKFGDVGNKAPITRLVLDKKKLNLNHKTFISLSSLRAKDSGRIAGPKAANLGELKHYFPKAVTEGLVIPFGVFYEFLQKPLEGRGSIYDWMRGQYLRMAVLPEYEREKQTRKVLAQLRQLITSGEPGRKFRVNLKREMQSVFGADGSYAVFVRSDTNVEDLPGFTGAGLNLTVPNVRGVNNVIDAILRVWASPFEERAYAWRQQRMDHPELVFPSVLLLKSVGVDKSGVMLTMDPESGRSDVLSLAVNYGIGGAVQGQQAEELKIDRKTGEIIVLNDATTPFQRVLNPSGGLDKVAVEADGDTLSIDEIKLLIATADKAERNLPQRDAKGRKGAADIEFGFQNGNLVLFQIRPFLRDDASSKHQYLLSMDEGMKRSGEVSMRQVPAIF